jgi:hypothetical protein
MNRYLRTGLLGLCALAGLGACCTKMDCDKVHRPEITVLYKNFVPGTPATASVYALNKNNGMRVDSVDLTDYFNGTVRLTEGLFGELEPGGFQDYNYVLMVGATAKDTIRDVTYQAYTYEVECNKCLLADGSARVQDFKDFQYRHEGRLYQDADTLVIER